MTRSNAVYATSERAGERGALVRLGARSDRKGLRQLGWHLGALAASGILVWSARGSLWLLPAMVGHGVLLVSLFAPLHESIHWTAFRTPPPERRRGMGLRRGSWCCRRRTSAPSTSLTIAIPRIPRATRAGRPEAGYASPSIYGTSRGCRTGASGS